MVASPDEMFYSFANTERLDINVSEAFLEAAWLYYRSWMAVERPQLLRTPADTAVRSNAMRMKTTCMLKNETGLSIKYWLSGKRGQVRMLQPGQVDSLSSSEMLVRRPGSATPDLATLSLWLLEDNPATHYLPLDKPGVYLLSLDVQKRQLFYTYEVCFFKGSKLLRVRSAITLFNRLSRPLDVRVDLAATTMPISSFGSQPPSGPFSLRIGMHAGHVDSTNAHTCTC